MTDSWYRKLPQDSAPVCINIDISPEMAAQSAQQNQAFCVTASDWSTVTSKYHPGSEGCRDLRTHIQHDSGALIVYFTRPLRCCHLWRVTGIIGN